MQIFGELCLLTAFVASGFAAFTCTVGNWSRRPGVLPSGLISAAVSLAALTACGGVLAVALVHKDFAFDYVAKYSSQRLAWHYSLSALWVGQAGSLLLWSWLTAVASMVFRLAHRGPRTRLIDVSCGLAMGYVCFLVAIMVFAADPMKCSLVVAREGAGLSPLLQHPAMMIHPPIVFAGYAAWTIPFALAVSALITGELDQNWVAAARPWAIFAWLLLGGGILLGADWAYEELGWGGYWGWDPVENGSLMPWLTGTALIHSLMIWRYRDGLKKTALSLAICTFGLCNFATFLTRSGIFSSLHAFSQSPIGWMFLGLLALLAIAGGILVAWRRHLLRSSMQLRSLWSRETHAIVAGVALLMLTLVVLVGTVMVPASTYVLGRKAVVGPGFYNAVLAPIGLLLLATTTAVPLLRWGGPPRLAQRRMLLAAFGIGTIAAFTAFACGVRRPEGLLVALLAAVAPVTTIAALLLDVRRRGRGQFTARLLLAWRAKRRSYIGYVIHLGFISVAIGVTGSSLGAQRLEVLMQPGETTHWNGSQIRYVRLAHSELPDKHVIHAELEITQESGSPFVLRPARHFHLLQEHWTTEVDIHSSWSSDFYTILNHGDEAAAVSLSLVELPLMRWLWFGGFLSGAGGLAALWPARRKKPVLRILAVDSSAENRDSRRHARRRTAA